MVLSAAIAAKLLGAERFDEYPTLEVGIAPATIGLAALILASGLAPLRLRRSYA